jgi:hypothetical protein
MYIFKIHGKEYKVRFTYRMICKDDLLDKVSNLDLENMDARGIVDKLTTTTAELLLAGLQKYHNDEFGYKDEKEKEQRIEDMLDLFDDYEDESTEDNEQSAASLFRDLQGELEKNGFLSMMMRAATESETMEQTAETVKKDMENESARVIAMTPTENE